MSEFSTKFKLKEVHNPLKLYDDFNYISGFEILNIHKPAEVDVYSENSEMGLLILEGSCDINIDGKKYGHLGVRKNVFTGIPTGVYVPIDTKLSIKSDKTTIAICKAKCSVKSTPAIISPGKVKIINIGKDNWSREVRIIIGPDSPSVNLILGETINPPGNWSGIPPAKHEKDNLPKESLHEELYYFKTDKPHGWGVERIYSPERSLNKLVYVEDNVVTFMPWGYHEIVAAPGYTLYYLFFLAGKGKKLAQFEDPDHNWIKNA